MSEPALFDSNILIDFLKGVEGAGRTMDRFEANRAISVITWIELLAGPAEAEGAVLILLSRFEVLALSPPVARLAATVRRTTRLKLPDAVILAIARVHERVLVTRNTKDFDEGDRGLLVPYVI